MLPYSYPITIKKENGQYCAYSDDFPGVHGLGETAEAARSSMLRGVRLYIKHVRRA